MDYLQDINKESISEFGQSIKKTLTSQDSILFVFQILISIIRACLRFSLKFGPFWHQFYVYGFFLSLVYGHVPILWNIFVTLFSLYCALYVKEIYIDENVEQDSLSAFYLGFSVALSTIILLVTQGFSNIFLVFYSWNNIYTILGNQSIITTAKLYLSTKALDLLLESIRYVETSEIKS